MMLTVASPLLILAFIVAVKSTEDFCESDEFACLNLNCILKMNWCDGQVDCSDGSDERFCRQKNAYDLDPNRCTGNKMLFICHDGKCIPMSGRCDGFSSCDDKSDELNCISRVESLEIPKDIEYFKAPNIQRSRPNSVSLGDSDSFEGLDYGDYKYQLEKAREWLVSQRNEDYGWGESTPRAIIAMYLSKIGEGDKTDEELLMDKQLDIQLSIALARNQTRQLSLSELALYINALRIACSNPKNFYGYDLVTILRERADYTLQNGVFVSPYVYLTLCVNNKTKHTDYNALLKRVQNQESLIDKIDVLSLSLLASSCMTRDPRYNGHSAYIKNFAAEILNKISSVGLPGNIYELSLVVQALNEVKVDLNRWNRKEAMDLILNYQNESGSFGDILATYFAMPILSGRSIVSSAHCDKEYSDELTPLAVLKNAKSSKITVRYALIFGEPIEVTQRIELSVAEGTNFLDIMRLAEEQNPNFRFNLDYTKKVPFVYSIGGLPNDAERGLYWTLHFPSNRSRSVPTDIREHFPKDKEETAFWLKPVNI